MHLIGLPLLLPLPHARAGVRGTPTIRLGGASGAQSSLIPCIDAFLGVSHNGPHESVDSYAPSKAGALRHMPGPHRMLLTQLHATAPASARRTRQLAEAMQRPEDGARLLEAHEECLHALTTFRKAHVKLVRSFIIAPSQQRSPSPLPPKDVLPPAVLQEAAAPTGGAVPAHASTPPASPLGSRSPSFTHRLGTMPQGALTPGGGSGASEDGCKSPTAVHALLGTGGSELVGFLSGRLLDTARAGVHRH